MKKDMQRLPQSFMGWRRRSESPMKIWALESYDLAVRYQQRNGEVVGKPSKSDLEFQKLISREEGEFRLNQFRLKFTKPVSDAVYNVELGGEKKITRFARIAIFRVYAKEVVHTFFMGWYSYFWLLLM